MIKTEKWDKVFLGEIADEITERVDKPSQSGFEMFVGLEHFVSGDLKIKQWGSTKNLVSAMKKFQKGDILFARRNAYLKRASIVEFDGVCSGDAFVIREKKDRLVPGFLAFIFNSESLWHYANSYAAGTMSKRVKWRDLAKYSFKLPPLDEQKRLADLLWSVDKAIESYVNLWEEIDILRKIHTKNLIENKTYPMRKISEVAIVTSGNSAPQGDKYFNGDKPFVRVQHFSESDLLVNIFDLINDLAIKDYKLKLFPKNSIVFTKSGASAYLEKKAMLKKPSYVVSHLGVLIPDEAEIMPNYLFYLFKGLNISRNCVSDYPTIDLSDIKRWVIPVPDKKNQQTIVCEFDEMIKNQQAVKKAQVDSIEIKKQIFNQIFG